MTTSSTLLPGDIDLSFAKDGAISPSPSPGKTLAVICDVNDNVLHASVIEDECLLARALHNGVKDESFNLPSWKFEEGDQSKPARLLLQPDGKIVVIGESVKDKTIRPAVARFHADGLLDQSFGSRVISEGFENASPSLFPYRWVDGCLQGDKLLIITTYFSAPAQLLSTRVLRLHNNGILDKSFGEGAGYIDVRFHNSSTASVNIQVQADGKIVVAGARYNNDTITRVVARYSEDGLLDVSFGQDGFVDLGSTRPSENALKLAVQLHWINRLIVQQDDKLLIAGFEDPQANHLTGYLMRLTKNGNIDQTFNNGKPVLTSASGSNIQWSSIAIQQDAKIVTVGLNTSGVNEICAISRFMPDGKTDDGFRRVVHQMAYIDISIQKGGRIIVSGNDRHIPRRPLVMGLLS